MVLTVELYILNIGVIKIGFTDALKNDAMVLKRRKRTYIYSKKNRQNIKS